MNRKEWKILPILLIFVLIISAFGCSKKDDEGTYTVTNENGEIEQYTFSGIPGDRPYNPARDDVVYDRDKTTVTQKDNNATQSPTESHTETAGTNASSAFTQAPTETPATEAPTTEATTKGRLTRADIERILRGFNGTEEEAFKECEAVLGRELTPYEAQMVSIIYNIIGNKPANPDITEPPLVPGDA